MKTLHIFYMFCFCLSVFWMSCEKADQVTTSTVAQNEQLTSREVASCDQCPVGDCCCSVESIPHSAMLSLRFCGTSDGTPGCMGSGPGACSSISGSAQTISLSGTGFRKLFCLNPNDAFSVTNISGLTATIILSCQHDLTNPQKDTITILNTGIVYFDSDNSCALTQCL